MQERGRAGHGGRYRQLLVACALTAPQAALADACGPGLTTLNTNPNDQCVLGDAGPSDAVRVNAFAPGSQANGIIRVVNNAAQVTIGATGNVQNGVTGAPVITVTAGTLANGILLESAGANRARITSAGDAIRVSGAGTSVTGGISNAGQINASSVGVRIASGSVSGGLFNSGRIQGALRAVWVEAAGSLDFISIGGSSAEFVGAVLATGADLRILSDASYRNQSALGSVFNVRSLEVQSGATFTLDAAFTVATGISNAGTFTLPGAASRSLTIPGTFANDGLLDLDTGHTFTLTGTYTNAGTTALATGSRLTLNGNFANTGAVTLTGTGILTTNGTFTNNGSLGLDVGSTLSVSGLFSNATSFTVPAGATFTTGGGIANSGTFVLAAASTLSTTGTFANPGTTRVEAGSTLTVNGLFENDGRVELAEGALLAVNGDYTQTGALRVRVSDNATFGRLSVSGTATLPSNAAVEVDVTGGGLATGLLDNVVSAGTLVTDGTFAVTDNSLLFDFAAVVDGNTVDLQVLDAPPSGGGGGGSSGPATGGLSLLGLVQTAGSRPAAGAAAVLDVLLRRPQQGDAEALAPIVDVFARLPSEAALVAAVNETLPLLTSAAPLATLGALTGANGVVAAREAELSAGIGGLAGLGADGSGLAAGDVGNGERSLWLRPFASFIQQGERSGAPGFESQARGLLLGGDFEPAPRWRLGGALALHHADIEAVGPTAGADQRARLSGWQFFATAARETGSRTRLTAQADVARLRTEGSRLLPTFGLAATSDFHTVAVHAGASVSQRWELVEGLDWLPALRADWTRLDAEGYREAGAGALGLVVERDVQQAAIFSLESGLEARLARDTRLRAQLGVGWDILAEQAVATVAYAGGGPAFTTPGIRPAALIGTGGVGLVAQLGEGGELALDYNAAVREDFTQQSAALTLRWAF
jgi:hypothetical protein